MKKIFTCAILFMCALSTFAQSGKIYGTIIDNSTKESMDYVNIALYKGSSNTPEIGGFSDESGQFNIQVPYGTYTLKASFLGYNSFEKKVIVTKDKPNVKIGNIILYEDAKMMKEIEVVGQKSGMSLEIDKKVFNVDQSIVSEGASASEILQNIPSVDIDTDGNVALRNSSSVEIWINGKPSGLSDTDKGQVLEMLPAETVEKVELLTNPSAKYNPEGSVGIINIVLKENRKGGYFGNVSTGVNYQEGSAYPGGNLGLNFTYSDNKWDVNFNASVRSRKRDRGSYNYRMSFEDADTTYLNQTNTSTQDRVNGFLKAGATYHIDKKNEIGLSAYGMYSQNWNKGNIEYATLNKDKDTTHLRERNNESTGNMGFYNVAIDYRHQFEKDTHEISANLNYFGRQRNSNSSYLTKESGDINPLRTYELQTLNESNNSASVQVDYFNKFTKNSKFEAGLKGSLNFTESIDKTFDSIYIDNTLIEDITKYNPFYYSEQIYAAYATYGNKFDWFSFQLGIRAEETITKANEVQRSYFQAFPSVYLSFELPKDNEIQVNYTRRINRPRGRRINNYIDRSDPTNISFGNPLLMPEFANSVEINYLKNWERHTLSVGLFYRYTENVIQSVKRLTDLGIMENTYENITYSQNAGAEIVAKNRLFNNYLDLTTSLSAYYYQLGANEEWNVAETNSFSWNARINANVKIISNLSAQITAYYNSPHIVAQGTVGDNYAMDLGLRANFLNKTLSLSLSVRDVLDSRTHTQNITWGENFYQENANTTCGRSYRLTLTYNFGNMKAKKQKKNENTNEDSYEDTDNGMGSF
ncbi:MAG TPA: outer membrane beta-barrel family protein [Candidatus Enterocola sp.]|nr:outer membrane beta-barrel family protein [Candidatus Enterocola sp.]